MICEPNAAEYQQLIDTARGVIPPTALIANATILNTYSGAVNRAHIWLSGKYIAYVGPDRPKSNSDIPTIELLKDQIIVPGYIEPHAHPFQLYNPYTFGTYLTGEGTLISVNDNSSLLRCLPADEQAAFIRDLDRIGGHCWLWWAYFEEGLPKDNGQLAAWLKRPEVLQGGELSHWLPFKEGSADLTRKLYEVRRLHKRMESHLPGASVNTLNLFAAAGASADHEALSAADIIARLNLGYYATIRYSSIRRDLPDILKELVGCRDLDWSKLMLTNDGATLPFLHEATHAQMIRKAIDCGVRTIDAYRMATLNPAVYYHLDALAGSVAPGRIANLNILSSLDEPRPVRILFEGRTVTPDNRDLPQQLRRYFPDTAPIRLPEKLPFRATAGTGIRLINDVITRTYPFAAKDQLADDENFLVYLNPAARRFLTTRIRHFSEKLAALASTYSTNGTILLIGRDPQQLSVLYQQVRTGFRGIAARFADGTSCVLPLEINGTMSAKNISELSPAAAQWTSAMKKSGYPFQDPFFSLLFLTAAHLPYVRLTADGLRDILSNRPLAASHPFITDTL